MVKNIKSKQKEIISDLIWHTKKVSNTLLYDIREGKEKLDFGKSLNIISSKIYTVYRKNNWHSEYLHSHMLQEAIIGVIASIKSYAKLNEMYEKDNTNLKGKPRFPRFKKEKMVQEIVFTKYAIRIEKNKVKLSISKKMQEKYKELYNLAFDILKNNKKDIDELFNDEQKKVIKELIKI